MVSKVAQEYEDHKSYKISENLFTKTTIIGQLLLYWNINPQPQVQHAYGIELFATAAAKN